MQLAREYGQASGWLVDYFNGWFVVRLLSLGLVPLAISWWARRRWPERRCTMVGIASGLVASPFSLGLYATVLLIPVLGTAFLVITVIPMLFHGSPGYYLATTLDLVPRGVVLRGVQNLYVDAMSALIWATVYGSIGAFLDRRRCQTGSTWAVIEEDRRERE